MEVCCETCFLVPPWGWRTMSTTEQNLRHIMLLQGVTRIEDIKAEASLFPYFPPSWRRGLEGRAAAGDDGGEEGCGPGEGWERPIWVLMYQLIYSKEQSLAGKPYSIEQSLTAWPYSKEHSLTVRPYSKEHSLTARPYSKEQCLTARPYSKYQCLTPQWRHKLNCYSKEQSLTSRPYSKEQCLTARPHSEEQSLTATVKNKA